MSEAAEDYFRRAYEAQRAGEFDRAVILYKKSIELHPTAEAHTFLGWTYSFQHRYRDAIAECRRAIEVEPEFGNPYNDIGAYLIELGRWEEAVPWFEKAIAAPRYDPRHFPHFNLARVYIRTYEYRKALEHLRRALDLEPHYASARKELNRLLCGMN